MILWNSCRRQTKTDTIQTRRLLDDALSVYYPVVCAGRTEEQIIAMEQENALPHGWENMTYEDFLAARRKLMAAKIKQAFEVLKGNVK